MISKIFVNQIIHVQGTDSTLPIPSQHQKHPTSTHQAAVKGPALLSEIIFISPELVTYAKVTAQLP